MALPTGLRDLFHLIERKEQVAPLSFSNFLVYCFWPSDRFLVRDLYCEGGL